MLSSAPRRRRRSRTFPWLLVVVLVLAAAAAGAVVTNALDTDSGTALAAGCNVTSVAERDLPAVVTIKAGGSSGTVGSGEVIRSNGYVLTNNHVVVPAVGGGALEVVFDNGKSAPATIVARDPLTDLAVIRVTGASNLRTISIGDSETLRIGQPVVVLGSPLGLASSVSSGIVSALGRSVRVPGEKSQGVLLTDAVQTDAAINPGNSGGALLNCAGALVGIPSAGATTGQSSGSIGLGFAIPVDSAMKIAQELISTGKATHAYTGLQAEPDGASADGQNGQSGGLYVSSVAAGSPASAAGVKAGDVIESVDGSPATSADQLMALSVTKRPGDRVQVKYESGDGSQTTATITLGREP